MPATYTQANLSMRVNTVLGKDVLLLAGFEGDEGVSTPFRFTLDLASSNPNIKSSQLLGTAASVTLVLPDGSERVINGRINRFTQLGRARDLVSYRAELVPWLSFLTLSSDCRIFQNLSPLDIVEQVFKGLKYTDFEIQCKGSYAPREFCVQFRESNFSFVSRLLEEEGIFYFFKHSTDKHVLVLADQSTAFVPCPGQPTANFVLGEGAKPVDGVTTFEIEDAVHTERVTLDDYDFEQPTLALQTSVTGTGQGEIYDYPGHYTTNSAGDRYARLRLEALETWGEVARGTSTCRAFTSGTRFDLKSHFRNDANKTYSLITIHHRGLAGGSLTGAERVEEYENSFVAIPYDAVFRPPRTTRKPDVGTQTALVVGPSNEEIYVDKYGRVKVQFYWDRQGKKNENSSCWIRVSSGWAGKNWGMVQLPRIGQEVVIDFLDGDPDEPVIVGRLYNGTQMPPYDLPANSTQSGIKSRSSKGGGASDSNELRFEDKTGSEEVYFHAQKDLDAVVEHDETLKVGNDRTIEVAKDDTRTVKGQDKLTITGDQTIAIEKGNQSITLGEGGQTISILKGNQEISLGAGNQQIALDTGDQSITLASGSQKIAIGTGNQTITLAQGNQTTDINSGNLDTSLGMGNYTLKLDLGQISQQAMQGIELTVGQNSISIDQTGITIKGMMISIQGQIQTEVKGTMTTVNGDGMLTLKGGITMIN